MKYPIAKRVLKIRKDYYNVEKIITRRIKGKNKSYLIKWVGYPFKDCSWEPVSHLGNIKDKIENFDKNFPNSIDKRGLKRYLYVVHQKESHIIKIKNPFLPDKEFKKEKIKKNDDIIICIDNSDINIEINQEKIEEEKDNVLKDDYDGNGNGVSELEETHHMDGNENSNDSENIVSEEKDAPKLIRPILIW
jgi:hypothetical protein